MYVLCTKTQINREKKESRKEREGKKERCVYSGRIPNNLNKREKGV
jgi:hypothetical protein